MAALNYRRRQVRGVFVDVFASLLVDLLVVPLLPLHHQALLERPDLLLHPLNALLLRKRNTDSESKPAKNTARGFILRP